MLGTIEELEREIEQFQNNMAASGEMTRLLQQMLEQIKNQNVAFDTESRALLAKITSIPDAVENANAASNETIQKNMEAELQGALNSFSKEQDKYIVSLEQVKQQIQVQSDLSGKCVKQVSDSADSIIAKTEAVPDQIRKDNQEMQKSLVADVDRTLESRNAEFSEKQSHFVKTMEAVTEKSDDCIKQVGESAERIMAKTEAVSDQIRKDNQEMQKSLIADINRTLESRNAEFSEKQSHFVNAMETATEMMEKCQIELHSKYQEFINTLKNTNLAHLHDENQQLKNELNKRTTILTVISAISVVVGIIGIFF